MLQTERYNDESLQVNLMDYYLHHLNSTVFLTTIALVLTIISYLCKNIVFCGNFCKKVSVCFKYKIPSRNLSGYTSNLQFGKPLLKQNLTEVSELKEVVVDLPTLESPGGTTPTTLQSSPATKNTIERYSITPKTQ